MDSGVKGRRSYKDKLRLRTKPRMQTDVLNTETSKYVKNYKPVAVKLQEPTQIESGKDGEEGKTVEIMKSDNNPRLESVVIDHDYGQHSVIYIHQILDEVLSSVVNLETVDGIREESEHIEATQVEEGEIVNDNEDLIESCWMSDASNDETCFDEIFQSSSEKKELDDMISAMRPPISPISPISPVEETEWSQARTSEESTQAILLELREEKNVVEKETKKIEYENMKAEIAELRIQLSLKEIDLTQDDQTEEMVGLDSILRSSAEHELKEKLKAKEELLSSKDLKIKQLERSLEESQKKSDEKARELEQENSTLQLEMRRVKDSHELLEKVYQDLTDRYEELQESSKNKPGRIRVRRMESLLASSPPDSIVIEGETVIVPTAAGAADIQAESITDPSSDIGNLTEDLSNQIKIMETENNRLAETLNRHLNEKNLVIKELRQSIDDHKQELRQSMEERGKYELKYIQLQQEKDAQVKTIVSLREARAENKRKILSLTEEKEKLQKSNDDHKQELTSLRDTRADNRRTISSLNEEKDKLRDRMRRFRKQNDELIEENRKKYKKVSDENKDLKKVKEALTKDQENMIKENKNLQKEVRSMEKDRANMEKQMKALEEKNLHFEKNNAIKEENSLLKEENVTLAKLCNILTTDNKHMRACLEQDGKHLEEKEEGEIVSELEQSEEKTEKQNEELKKKEEKILELEKTILIYEKRFSLSAEDHINVREKNSKLDAKIEKMKKEISSLVQKNKDLKDTLKSQKYKENLEDMEDEPNPRKRKKSSIETTCKAPILLKKRKVDAEMEMVEYTTNTTEPTPSDATTETPAKVYCICRKSDESGFMM